MYIDICLVMIIETCFVVLRIKCGFSIKHIIFINRKLDYTSFLLITT